MNGENIICFAKDWFEHPTSNNHVMMELAKRNRVLWINSLSTRTPKLGSKRDIGKIFKKLARFFKGPQRVSEKLWVYTPIVLPFPHSRFAAAINERLLKMTLRVLRRRLGMKEFQLWTFLPSTSPYVGKMGESVSIYYCVDDWSKFAYLDRRKTEEAEQKLCRAVDVVFGVGQSLVEQRLAWNPETHLARHGVDHELFSRALDEKTEIPAEIGSLPKPVIGMYGTLESWIDLQLISYLAERHPDWSIVLIGKKLADLSIIQKHPNVHIIGSQPHDTLPNFCKGFSVGIIPYVIDARLKTVNPIKLREYLSAGLPVVSTDLPEVRVYCQYCEIAGDFAAFEAAIEKALATDSAVLHQQRSHAMRGETWERKVAAVCEQVMRVKQNKTRMIRAHSEGPCKKVDVTYA